MYRVYAKQVVGPFVSSVVLQRGGIQKYYIKRYEVLEDFVLRSMEYCL